MDPPISSGERPAPWKGASGSRSAGCSTPGPRPKGVRCGVKIGRAPRAAAQGPLFGLEPGVLCRAPRAGAAG